jgi:DNA-binding beta-propeller fold protein YncE
MRTKTLVGLLTCFLLAGLSLGAIEASAYREGLIPEGGSKGGEEAWLQPSELATLPEKQVEGACGVAVAPTSRTLYVADYYHRAIEAFSSSGAFEGSQVLSGGDPRTEINELDAVCGLAVDAAGNRYGSELHQAVITLPGEDVVDPGPSTGVAVDEAGNIYVDDRTYVAVYDAPVTPGEPAAEKIGLGNLVDAYGVAVDSKAGLVYVADTASDTVKVFESVGEPEDPIRKIDGPSGSKFSSLKDGAVAVDTSEGEGQGHLLVIDDTDPGAERPGAAIYEFSAAGNYLDRLENRTYGGFGEGHIGPLFGEPSGLAIDPKTGDLYVTTGNSAKSNVLKYGPFEPFAPLQALGARSQPSVAASVEGASAPGPSPAATGRAARRARARTSVTVQRGPVRVKFDGKLTPHALPRHGVAPVGIAVDTRISGTRGGTPPQLRRIAIEINRNGHLSAKGLPVCEEREIQPSTTAGARAACGGALVGEGHFAANVKLPEQSPFPSSGKVLAFNGRLHGKPAILAHIYGTQPAPTSYVLPFSIRESRGTYGTVLETSLPHATGNWGYVTGLKMNLRRSFRFRGRQHSYLSAGCPAPAGFPGAAFPLARTSFAFAGGMTLVSVLNRSCKAKG